MRQSAGARGKEKTEEDARLAAKTTYSPTRNNGKVASKWSDDEDHEGLLVFDSVEEARDELD